VSKKIEEITKEYKEQRKIKKAETKENIESVNLSV